MTPYDKNAFTQILVGLGEVYGEEIGKVRLGIYYNALQAYPLEAIRHAARELVGTSKFFPKPAEFVEYIKTYRNPQRIEPERRLENKSRIPEHLREQYHLDCNRVFKLMSTDAPRDHKVEAVLMLDNAYPNMGFKEVAECIRNRS